MAEQDNDNLEHVQGRWKTGDADNVVVEADQVWMLGDSEVCGTLSVDLVDKEPVVTFNVSGADAEQITGRFAEAGQMIMWSDGDMWKKLKKEDIAAGLSVQSTTGKNIGRLSQVDELDAEGVELAQRRWTKNGQRGSEKAPDGVAVADGSGAPPVAAS